MTERLRAGIVGASGYTGGELLRILLGHPHVEVVQAASESRAGHYVYSVHPNLRGQTDLKFVKAADLKPCDLLCLCLPHGESGERFQEFAGLAERLIDLSADFRLRDPEAYGRWYGRKHPRPELLAQFVYGLPELHREAIRHARWVSGVGCLGTTAILGLFPLFRADLVDPGCVVIEAKVGSSAGGNQATPATHHPERSGAVRAFEPTGHRHTGEVEQELAFHGRPRVHFSATAIEAVRGIQAVSHVFLKAPVEEKELWRVYRAAFREEPFLRIVKDRQGIYRYPEPKILAGSNYCDVGFERDPHSARVVVISALDNLVKGAAGSAVQSLNLMCDFPETAGLEFPGLHPI